MWLKTKITYIDGDWTRVKNACRTTVNKTHTNKEPDSEFITKILISEHSPIRLIKIGWIWNKIKSWVAVHWVRHKWECFVSTQRSDRTGINRDELTQGELVNFEGEGNCQNLIDSWRKRLCYQASKETREHAEDFKIQLREVESELSDVLVPNCIYRMGCPEFEECGFFSKFIQECDVFTNINKRYDAYNKMFYKRKGDKLLK